MNSAIEIIPTDEMSREDFLKLRTQGLGGTDVAAILGYLSYRKPIDVYLEKTGQADPTEDTIRLQRGRDLEGQVAAWYQRRHPAYKVSPGGIVRNPDTFPVFGSVDRFVHTQGNGADRLLECKTVNFQRVPAFGDDGSDQIPDGYRMQVMTYLAVTGFDQADLFAASLDEDREYHISNDPEITAMLIEVAKQFWRRVELKDPPPPDESEAYSKYLTGAFKARKDFPIEVHEGSDAETYHAIQELKRIRRDLKMLETAESLHENTIKAAMGEHTVLICGEDRLTWTPVAIKEKINWEDLAFQISGRYKMPEKDWKAAILNNTTPGSASRRFNVPKGWTKDGE